MRNSIEFEASGRFALFTDPVIGSSAGRCTLPLPTYGALVGLCCSIYSHRSMRWVIDEVRVMNRILTEPLSGFYRCGCGLRVDCLLRDVRYQIRAHFVPSGSGGFCAPRIHSIAQRSLERGGRRRTYFGTSSCPCDVAPCRFGSGEGFYDGASKDFGLMYHSIDGARVLLFDCRMSDGMIRFPPPQQCGYSCALGGDRRYALAASAAGDVQRA
ncbi:MAG: type I-C CRISPR-associated protein Cas5c [Oscillospiraceae bacterium]